MMECLLFRVSHGQCSFSPNGLHLASVSSNKLTIRTATQLQPLQAFRCLDAVEHLEWSTDSELVMTAYLSCNQLEIWAINQPKWRCKINAGPYGLFATQFTPDSRHILTTANLHLRLTIWSLGNHEVFHINFPEEANPGLDFSVGGSHLAVAERRSARDCVAIYSCTSWKQLTVIDCGTIDLGGLKWSPDGSKIAIWDGSHRGKVCVYSTSKDGWVKVCDLDDVFGVHDVEWSPSAQILAVAVAGSKVQLVNHVSWRAIATLSHSSRSSIVYVESECRRKYHVVTNAKFPLPGPTPGGPLGLAFSPNARYLAVVDYKRPRALCIWDMTRLSLHSVLVHNSSIKDFKWSSKESRLALVCGTAAVYTWTPVGADVTDINSTTCASERIEWLADGRHLMVSGQDSGFVCKMK